MKTLFNLSSFLTKRDAWAGSFEELLLDTPRPDSDMPRHLPDAPRPATPWDPPPGTGDALGYAETAGPGHCSAWDGASQETACAGPAVASLKQRRNLRLLSHMTGSPEPDIDAMDVHQATRAMGGLWALWNQQQRAARRL